MIYRGFDAQHIGNLAKAKSLGATAMHRYDSGPQKTGTARDWMAKCRELGMAYIVQGTLLVAQKFTIDELQDDASLISISQDDEPDLNRYDKKVPDGSIYRPEDVPKPHDSIIGWRKPEILQKRFDDWSKTGKPISVNFAGPNLTNPYYVNGQFHKPYIKASNYQGHDYHVVNNRWETWKLIQIGFAIDRINSFGGNCRSCYFEMSDQALDSDLIGGPGRGPTPTETSTEIWIALTRGCKEVWGFPQQIGRDKNTGKAFDYWTAPPEIDEQVAKDFARITKYEEIIDKGERKLIEDPPLKIAPIGVITWPTKGTCTWKLGDKTLVVTMDYSGKTEPTFVDNFTADVGVSRAEYNAVVVDRDNWKTLALNRKASLDAAKATITELNKVQEDLTAKKATLVDGLSAAADGIAKTLEAIK